MADQKSSEKGTLQAVNITALAPAAGSRKKRKRLGIGEGSGNGKTCGHGQKGQKMRSGYSQPRGFEGGQMPIHRRLPKTGFTSRKRVTGQNVFTVVRLERLETAGFTGEVTFAKLVESGVVRSARERIKLLGNIEMKVALKIEAHAASASAKSAIEKAGGEVRLLD